MKNFHNETNLKVFSLSEVINLKFPPKDYILEPFLPEKGIVMVYSPTGVGKTWFSIGVANAVATGTEFLKWKAPKPRGVLFIDGEMQAYNLIERLKLYRNSTDDLNSNIPLYFLANDLQDGPLPDLASCEGQDAIDQKIRVLEEENGVKIELIIFDNLSSLLRSGVENEGESWLPFQNWLLDLRRRKVSVLYIHHANKSGDQRGTSRRMDILDTVVCLKNSSKGNCEIDDLSFEVHFEKTRGVREERNRPFIAKMTTYLNQNGKEALKWECCPLQSSNYEKIINLTKQGKALKEIASEVGIHKSNVSRNQKTAREEGRLD